MAAIAIMCDSSNGSTVTVIFPHHYSTYYSSQLEAFHERFPTLHVVLDGVDHVKVVSESLTEEARVIYAWIQEHFRNGGNIR